MVHFLAGIEPAISPTNKATWILHEQENVFAKAGHCNSRSFYFIQGRPKNVIGAKTQSQATFQNPILHSRVHRWPQVRYKTTEIRHRETRWIYGTHSVMFRNISLLFYVVYLFEKKFAYPNKQVATLTSKAFVPLEAPPAPVVPMLPLAAVTMFSASWDPGEYTGDICSVVFNCSWWQQCVSPGTTVYLLCWPLVMINSGVFNKLLSGKKKCRIEIWQ